MFRDLVTRCLTSLAAVGVVCVCANSALADTLLFADNYNSSNAADSSDVNSGLVGRRSGVYASSTYVMQNYVTLFGTQSGNYGSLQVGTDPAIRGDAIVDHNFYGADAAGGLNVDLRCWPSTDGDSVNWVGLVIGNNGTANPPTINNGLIIALRGNGDLFLRENGDTVATGGLGFSNAVHDFHVQITGVGDNNPFDGVGGFHVKVYADNNQATALEYTSSIAFATNYMGLLGSANAVHLVDSLSISSQSVPEPGTIVLLATALTGLLCYAWRKRK